MTRRTLATLLLIGAAPLIQAQLLSDQDARDQMKYDVQYLASDLLEGRETGTRGEQLAYTYIAQKYASIGLMPYGDSATYLQAYTFAAEPEVGPGTVLQIGRKKLALHEDFYPLSSSASIQAFTKLQRLEFGIEAPDLGRNEYEGVDVTGKAVAFSISSPDGIHPHSKFLAHHDLRARIDNAIKHGAAAVILFNEDPNAEDPRERLSSKVEPCSVPVVFLTKNGLKKLGQDGNPVAIGVEIRRPQRTGHNVVGMIDNGRKDVVVIGAHFDHLGFGDEGSLHRGEPAVHNGADDNASGVAVLLQLARDLAEMDEARGNNYLFIAFSGEEKGLYGSNYWTKHPTVPIERLNYMINLDMVGRVDSAGNMGINGVGTSPAWAELQRIKVGGFTLKTTDSGIGPSDHTSFYLQGVPAIHFFSGTHADYHKPSDDEDKVNYDGMLRTARFIESLVTNLNDDGKVAFTKTQEVSTEDAPRFKVTLGVVPDYMFDGKGMRIDGITDGKPAAKAGLQVGDVVVRIGDKDVTDMMSYMKALSAFSKGDTVPVKVLRKGSEVEANVTF
ncbi:MAG: M28 family peptidase [Flavobacteriales bacterium]|nr:M28 family peptidase [Flavobacteriales bacterium]